MFSPLLQETLVFYNCSKTIIRNLNQHVSHNTSQYRTSFVPKKHVYQKLYPWTHVEEFADHLASNVIYNDGRGIAIAKPFGVGIHTPYDKSNIPGKIEPKIFGDPRYCIADALPILRIRLGFPNLSIAITEDRTTSGMVVMGTSQKATDAINRSMYNSRHHHRYPFTYHCITYGPPLMDQLILEESVAVHQALIDEKTKEKEPEIVRNAAKTFLKREDVRHVHVKLRTLDYNSALNIARVEISCTRTNFHFVRCYLADRCCFILGDPRFPRRIGHVLGQAYSLPLKNQKKYNEEPLPQNIRKILEVPNNKSIPLMLHLTKLSLFRYTRGTVLDIENVNYPEHFIWTMNRLIEASKRD